MPHWEMNQWVGNCKTSQTGTIASGMFKGGSGEFKGYLVVTGDNRYEIWDESVLVLIPRESEIAVPPVPAPAGASEKKT